MIAQWEAKKQTAIFAFLINLQNEYEKMAENVYNQSTSFQFIAVYCGTEQSAVGCVYKRK